MVNNALNYDGYKYYISKKLAHFILFFFKDPSFFIDPHIKSTLWLNVEGEKS